MGRRHAAWLKLLRRNTLTNDETGKNPGITNAMSIDVEDYFQVSAFESQISPAAWDRLPVRVEQNTDKALALFDDYNVKATFFTLGWVAERYPDLVRRIISSGHELACHGYSHVRVSRQNPTEFRKDVLKAKSILEHISGKKVKGYRAASYSIGRDNLWALEILEETGFEYSSSIYPVKHDLYGMPEAPRFSFRPGNAEKLLEIPITTTQLLGKNIPCGGGGFFRFFPYAWSKYAIREINAKEKKPTVFYLHPWELDYDQPRQAGISVRSRLRHYLNLSRMEDRMRSILSDFKWNTMESVYLTNSCEI